MYKFWDHCTRFAIRQSVRLGHWQPYRALQQTFNDILPLVLVGAWAQAITASVFSRAGFFAQIYSLPSRIPHFQVIHNALNVINTFTMGIVALAAAFFIAQHVAAKRGSNHYVPGITSVVSFLILNATVSRTGSVTVILPNLGTRGIFAGLLLGYLIGWLFTASWHFKQQPISMSKTAILGIITGVSALIRLALYALASSGLTGIFYSATSVITGLTTHAIIRITAVTTLNNFLSWLGIPGPIDPLGPALSSATTTVNLNYALTHTNLSNVPYPISMSTVYQPFAMFGGVGMTLGLIIAVLWVGRQRAHRQLAKMALVPGIVNVGSPMLLGYPLLLNPIMLIPYILAPFVNMAVAWVAIRTRIMPPSVYNVPGTTPGPLQAFLGTNGSWVALVVALVCLFLSVLIYLPFVRIADAANEQLSKGGVEDAENNLA